MANKPTKSADRFREKVLHVNEDGRTTMSMGVRMDLEMAGRIHAVAEKTRRTVGMVIKMCVEDHLPVMEKQLGIKPPPVEIAHTTI